MDREDENASTFCTHRQEPVCITLMAAIALQRDIADLSGGKFEGDTFDAFANGQSSPWIYEALFNLENLSGPAVNAMAGRGDAA